MHVDDDASINRSAHGKTSGNTERLSHCRNCDAVDALMRMAWKHPVCRDHLEDMVDLGGLDPQSVWEELIARRRSIAYFNPFANAVFKEESRSWHTVPESLQLTLRNIAELTRSGSALDVLASEREGKRFITQQYLEEMIANLRFDGYHAEYENIRAVLLEERPPISTSETLALNFHRIMMGFSRLEDRSFDEDLLRDFYERLTRVDPLNDPIDTTPEFKPSSPLGLDFEKQGIEEIRKRALGSAIKTANWQEIEETRHPIMVSMLVNCQFWHVPIFEGCNNLMGCLASRFFLYREGYPVFRFIPKIRILEKWKLGLYSEEAETTFIDALETAYRDLDWTVYYDTFMKLMLEEARTLDHALSIRSNIDEQAIEGIRRVPYLNYRQTEVVKEAVLVPEREFLIAEHQRRYEVVYSTARADLEHLANIGLFTRRIKGAAYSYRAEADLKSILIAQP